MLTLPASVLSYLLRTTTVDRLPAYLCVSPEGNLTDWGGHLAEYGIVDLQRGGAIGEQVYFLEGLLPLNGAEVFLPCLKTDRGRCADVHLFPDQACDWVLLLNATANELQHHLIQQYRNQISLLQAAQTQQSRSLSLPDFCSALPMPLPGRKNLTVLFTDLRGLVSFSEQHAPEEVFSVLNCYLRTVIEAIVTEAGWIDRLLGNTVMACFGVLPILDNAATHAIRAGLRIQAAVQEMNHLRQLRQQPTFEMGIGIASGSIALGIMGDRRYRVLGAIGSPVDRAAALQQQANSGEILIDESTFNQATLMQPHFAALERSIPQLSEPIRIYAAGSNSTDFISTYATEGGSSNE